MTWFDHDGRPTAADETHPVDMLEPIEEEPERGTPPTITLVEAIARTFFTGDPRITVIAWRILVGDEWDSIRACARRVGCSPAAISRRLRILVERFGMRPPTGHLRRLARWEQRQCSRKEKRREATRPPAAADEQLEDNNPHSMKGGRL